MGVEKGVGSIKEYFGKKENVELYLKRMQVKQNALTKESCGGDANIKKGKCYGKSGYRLILEPIISVLKHNRVYLYTFKQLMYVQSNYNDKIIITDVFKYNDYIKRMYTQYDDINVKVDDYKKYKVSSYGDKRYITWSKTLKSGTNGLGYNIIDITEKIVRKEECDYFNPAHFAANVNGTASKGKGSGPNKEDCCEYINDNWSQYKKLLATDKYGNITLTKNMWKKDHPECIQDTSTETKPSLSCTGNNVSEFGQNATDDDLLGSIGGDRDQGNAAAGNGKFLRKYINKYCKVLCSEKIKLTFPKLYKEAVSRGTHIVWPTQENHQILNKYPLEAEGTATCLIYIDKTQLVEDNKKYRYYSCNCHNEVDENGEATGSRICDTCRETYYDWDKINATVKSCESSTNSIKSSLSSFYDLKGTFKVSHTDKEYGGEKFELERYKDGHDKYETTGFNVSEGSPNFTIKQKVKYKIPDKVYRYILKNKTGYNKSVHTLPAGIGNNYYDLKYGNLPISAEAEDGIYNLEIEYEKIGGFSDKLVDSTKTYTCNYRISSGGGCKCDNTTAYPGRDLTSEMAGSVDGKPHACDEAKKLFCNTPPPVTDDGDTDNPNGDDNKCPSGTDFEEQTILTNTCARTPNCMLLTCNLYVCPDNTKAAGRPLNAIIAQYLANHPGTTLNDELIKYIIQCSCNNEDFVIYRTIDLKVPFPGKSGDGRDAGFNWNDANLIREKIIRNRGVSDNKIYTPSKVMYHFKLNPDTIRKIRTYNSSHSYSDFLLECKANGGKNCISPFVHDTTYGIQSDGTCFSPNSFASCR